MGTRERKCSEKYLITKSSQCDGIAQYVAAKTLISLAKSTNTDFCLIHKIIGFKYGLFESNAVYRFWLALNQKSGL